MKKILLTVALFAVITVVPAQKKYEKMVYGDASTETAGATIIAKDVVSTKDIAKFQLKISNKSDRILLYKPEESVFRYSGKEAKPVEKSLIIHPGETDHRVVNFKGNDFQVNEYEFQVEGLYRISDRDNSVEAPEFMLPPSTNDFKAGSFSCDMKSLSKESDKTTVKFECRYTGDKIGVINPGRAAVKLPNGDEIANAKGNSKSELLLPGESRKITLVWNRMEGGKATDMQKIKMQILWRDTFVEAEPEKLPPANLNMKLDESKSK